MKLIQYCRAATASPVYLKSLCQEGGGLWGYSEKNQSWGLAKLLCLDRSVESFHVRANLRSNLDGYFQRKPLPELKRQTKTLANPFVFTAEPNLLSVTCTSCSGLTNYFLLAFCFPSPFMAQVWQQHFRCTKGIKSTLPSQSGGVWVSNISFTDFLGGKNHFSLTWREECTKLAEIKGPVKKLKGPQHGLYRGAQWHRRTVS